MRIVDDLLERKKIQFTFDVYLQFILIKYTPNLNSIHSSFQLIIENKTIFGFVDINCS